MREHELYATPRTVTDLAECDFYHSMQIPGYGPVEGLFDLRKNISRYFGGVDFKGKRVLEIGSASGFCSFYLESQGAEVVGYDLSEKEAWDVVPFSRTDHREAIARRQAGMRRVNNGFWLAHKAYGSNVRIVYGSSYDVPEQIGPVDACVFASVLLHVRDPFLALQRALRLTRELVVVTEPIATWYLPSFALSLFTRPKMGFMPNFRKGEPMDTWWFMPPRLVKRLIGVLGFESAKTHYHTQRYRGRRLCYYTVVGRRS